MAKKHRVKRQKYVDHLRKVEKERDAYLVKQKNKRSRVESCIEDDEVEVAQHSKRIKREPEVAAVEQPLAKADAEVKKEAKPTAAPPKPVGSFFGAILSDPKLFEEKKKHVATKKKTTRKSLY
ncbi:hypothetical protein ADEAN_000368800 [Angomonas deanei]|uniref:Uncharacterized protein n=1 Tax=Angomonas deanei TaxID=59799 RepID=A0A7G2CBC7_9TRYP|nr:hypothetical protein ADEAN_000368800 [Angomonas deanei]